MSDDSTPDRPDFIPELDYTPVVYQRVSRTWLSRRPGVSARPTATISVLFLALACAIYWANLLDAGRWMPATGADVYEKKELWRLWTTVLAHADLKHLLSNSFLFYVLGYFLSGYFGALVFPWTALLMGGVINAVSLATYPPGMQLIGASGVVFWMGGAWLALYALIDVKTTRTARAVRAIGVMLALFFPSEAFDPEISYRTHMLGLALGALWGFGYYFWRRREFRAAVETETVTDG